MLPILIVHLDRSKIKQNQFLWLQFRVLKIAYFTQYERYEIRVSSYFLPNENNFNWTSKKAAVWHYINITQQVPESQLERSLFSWTMAMLQTITLLFLEWLISILVICVPVNFTVLHNPNLWKIKLKFKHLNKRYYDWNYKGLELTLQRLNKLE